MHLVFFTHPSFFPSISMARFAKLLTMGMEAKGHTVTVWSPQANLVRLPIPKLDKKWLGYIDQYLLFPREVKDKLKECPPNTLFVFVDNALGPWLPLVANRPHVMHCHDFLAFRSALGNEPENPTRQSGKLYQKYINRGCKTGKHFISDSYSTQADLHRFLDSQPLTSEMVYVGLNPLFQPHDPLVARTTLSRLTSLNLENGYLLHVGANVWYKNRIGVIELYEALCKNHGCQLPLLLIGSSPTLDLIIKHKASSVSQNIHFLTNVTDEIVCKAYSGATLFLFPSLAEGFGWPIVEAMASGCPVITTNEAPMTEVAGGAAVLIERRPHNQAEISKWANSSALTIYNTLFLSEGERRALIHKGFSNSQRFSIDSYIDQLECIYERILIQST